jgi:(4S)-4-hydroxy-5-phosphonooxypentane-2,3-dione isomerase
MIVLVAMYTCQPGKSDEVLRHLKRMSPLVKQSEPGCAMYQVSRANDNADLLMLYEQYTDETALQTHRETAYFKEIIEGTVIPLLEKRERSFYSLEIS